MCLCVFAKIYIAPESLSLSKGEGFVEAPGARLCAISLPEWRLPPHHDRGDFSLPDWCDKRWSNRLRPIPVEPVSSALRTELTRRRSRATVWSVQGGVQRPSHIQCVSATRRGEWGLPPISAQGACALP
jgi:hypothetical protein